MRRQCLFSAVWTLPTPNVCIQMISTVLRVDYRLTISTAAIYSHLLVYLYHFRHIRYSHLFSKRLIEWPPLPLSNLQSTPLLLSQSPKIWLWRFALRDQSVSYTQLSVIQLDTQCLKLPTTHHSFQLPHFRNQKRLSWTSRPRNPFQIMLSAPDSKRPQFAIPVIPYLRRSWIWLTHSHIYIWHVITCLMYQLSWANCS